MSRSALIAAIIAASYSPLEQAPIAQLADDYLRWLDSLPVLA